MGTEKIKRKGLVSDNIVAVDNDLDLINQHTIKPLTEDEVFTFKVQLCDNDVDRVGDKMSDTFLADVAKNIVGLTGLKDHDWSSDNQTSRLYDAQVVVDDTVNSVGETRKYVLGKAYTLSKYKDYIDKINAGLLKETSISFESEGDTCSICGEEMIKDTDDIGHCCNGHCAGEVYEGVLCYNNINKLKDLLEWSLVAVPCQRNAGIKNKNLGGNIMKKAEFLIRQFMSSKAYEKAEDADKDKLKKALDDSEDKELSDEDIKVLVEENSKLKEKLKAMENKVKEAEGGRTKDKIEAIVDKEFDKVGLITPEVKELLKKEIPWDDLKLEDGQIPGLADVFAGMKNKYKGLFVDAEEVEEESGHEEPDGDEPAVLTINDREKLRSDAPEDEEPDGDEDKITVVDRNKSKGYKKPSGITFGSTSKAYDGKKVNKVKPGIYFNN